MADVTDTKSIADELQTEQARKLLLVLTRLKALKLGHIIDLPQLIVLGDQSSGKSSLLEAITGLQFPRNDTLCTRFATEIVIRSSATPKVRATIVADEDASAAEKSQTEAFDEDASDMCKFGVLFEKAATHMGLKSFGRSGQQKSTTLDSDLKAFSKHTLRVEISGPDRADLTLVDLPGYVHSRTKKHTSADMKFVKQLANKFMKQQRTIILAVVSATSEYSNQVVLDEVRKIDKNFSRTMGIITKLDQIEEDGGKMEDFLDLAQNKDEANILALGWHVVRNRSTKERDISMEQRNANEDRFFVKDIFARLPKRVKGNRNLRTRLAKEQTYLLKQSLPKVHAEVERQLEIKNGQLSKFGVMPSEPKDQQKLLIKISQSVKSIVDLAVRGNYDDDFFRASLRAAPDLRSGRPMDTQLLAMIRETDCQLAVMMRKHGHAYKFPKLQQAIEQVSGGAPLWDDYAQLRPKQTIWDDNKALQWVQNCMIQTGGLGLPGQIEPDLVNHLFRDLSQNWEACGIAHIEYMDDVLYNFFKAVIQHVYSAPARTCILRHIEKALDGRTAKAKSELREIIEITQQAPSTSDPHFHQKLENMRNLEPPLAGHLYGTGNVQHKQHKFGAFKEEYRGVAEEARNVVLTYYQGELEYFIKAVHRHIIIQQMVKRLGEETFNPSMVSDMTEKEIAALLAEDDNVTDQRDLLESEIALLNKAREQLKDIGPSLKRDRDGLADGETFERAAKRAGRRGRC